MLHDNELLITAPTAYLTLDSDVLEKIFELDDSRLPRYGRHAVRIPCDEVLTLLHLLAVSLRDGRARHQLILLKLVLVAVLDHDSTALGNGDIFAIPCLDGREVLEPDDTGMLRFIEGLVLAGLGGSADVERSHRQLGAGLSDGLRGDDSERVAEDWHFARRKVLAIALCANAMLALARQHRADMHAGDARLNQLIRIISRYLAAFMDDDMAVIRMPYVINAEPASDSGDESRYRVFLLDVAAGLKLDPCAVDGMAVMLDADDVMRHIDQTACHVS